MPNISYNLEIKNILDTTNIDNRPAFNYPVKEFSFDFFKELSQRNYSCFESGSLNWNNLFVEDKLLKIKELNGPCLLFDQLTTDELYLITPEYILDYNNNNAYIFKRFKDSISIDRIIEAIYEDSKFKIENTYNEIRSDIFILEDIQIVGLDGTYDNLIVRSSRFPISISSCTVTADTVFSINPSLISYDAFVGIVSIPILKTQTSQLSSVKIQYSILPCIYPLVREQKLELSNNKEITYLRSSNRTSSIYDNISISPRTITLDKSNQQNIDSETVIIENWAYEYLFIEPEQDIRINNKLIPAGTESILPGKYNELVIKLARSIYTTSLTSFKIDIGVYDRYNQLKKYIDSITINITG